MNGIFKTISTVVISGLTGAAIYRKKNVGGGYKPWTSRFYKGETSEQTAERVKADTVKKEAKAKDKAAKVAKKAEEKAAKVAKKAEEAKLKAEKVAEENLKKSGAQTSSS
jgi:biopolymer transport protein ExbB/TolQ